MQGDIGLFIDAPNEIDIHVVGNDLATDGGLRTAIIMSLFTDCRVDQDELPLGEMSRRGWWGDLFWENAGDQLGSRLWLLSREKRTLETLNRAEDYTKEALKWMLDDGVAASIDVEALYDENGALAITVLITRPNTGTIFRFQTNWDFEAEQEA